MTFKDFSNLGNTINVQRRFGSPGAQGVPGVQGQTGDDGFDGLDGQSILGPAGQPGLPGNPGSPGIDGEEGADGAAIPGPQGQPGSPGAPGPAGIDGEDGAEGLPAYGVALPPRGATSTKTVAAPTAPNSLVNFTMQGLAGSVTPRTTGNLLVSIAGTVTAANDAFVDNGISLQGSYGTGTAPTSNAALTGAQAGAVQTWTWPVAPTAVGDVNYGFNIVFLIPAAVLGATYWLDLAAKAITTASDAALVGVVITAIEF